MKRSIRKYVAWTSHRAFPPPQQSAGEKCRLAPGLFVVVLATGAAMAPAPAPVTSSPEDPARVPAAARAEVPPRRTALPIQEAGQVEAEEALLGFDPVELIRGEEVFGDEELAVVHEGYRYLFASEHNRELFLGDPDRWGIQLGGLCARMGVTTGGDPGLWAVHDGRIYIFGADACHRLFTDNPGRYLPPEEGPPLAEVAADAARERGARLLSRAVEAHGGADALDAVESCVETGRVVDGPRAGTALVWKVAWGPADGSSPPAFRREREVSAGMLVDLVRGDEAFYLLPDGRSRSMRPAQGHGLAAIFKHHPLWILRARSRSDFVAAAADAAAADAAVSDAAADTVDVEFDGLRMTVSVDADGRIHQVAWTGRGPGGEWGRVVETWSEFRPVGGLTLPHRRARTFDGEPWPGSQVQVDEVVVDAPLGADAFRR